MARGRTQNRMEKRAEHEAYERRQAEDEEDRDDDDEDDDDGEEEAAEAEPDVGDEEDLGDEDEAPKKKKKPVKEPKAPKKARPRSRTAKVTRMMVVWGVFNNSNVRVAVYNFKQKQEAEEHAARLTADKKSTHFVQPVKEPIEEKKEA